MQLAILQGGEEKADYIESFMGRLQVNRQTGSLTIKHLKLGDSGIYQGKIIAVKISSHRFHLTVYGG